jgi:hypothetical protein
MCNDTPKFSDTGQGDSPTSGIGARALNGFPGSPVLDSMSALGVNEEVGINGDHARAVSPSIPTF